MDSSFRNGFWTHASMRFFYLYSYMKKYNVENVIHIENDVMIFYNVSVLEPYLHGNAKIYLPFDSYESNIASIMFIPTGELLGRVLEQYDSKLNDMQNFVVISKRFPEWIDSFPIFILGVERGNPEIDFVCKNYHTFGGFLFDGAAIGQYLGGIYPANCSSNKSTVGFVNETCVIKYNKYNFYWKLIDGVFCPFMVISSHPSIGDGKLEFPIFNLHAHCKDLKTFIL